MTFISIFNWGKYICRDIVSNILNSNGVRLKKFQAFGIDDQFCSYNGSYDGIKKKYQLTEKHISKKIFTKLIR